jgi:hypothetical protein
MTENEDLETFDDPSVPTELLELHVELEQAQVSPEQFKEVFGGAGNES